MRRPLRPIHHGITLGHRVSRTTSRFLKLIPPTIATAMIAAGLAPLVQADEEPSVSGGAANVTTHKDDAESTDFDEIIITAAPHARRRFDVIQGTNTLSNEDLERSLRSTIGETLAEMPGISSTYFGPGASRPVIRGLDGPRIRVLQNGLGVLDASVTSPDHAVLSAPLAARRVEVIRGAATLLYGSSAIGGVVNIDDGRIPKELPSDVAEGEIRGLYGSAADEKAASAGLSTSAGPVAFRASGFFKAGGNVSIPGFAPSDALLADDPGLDPGPRGGAENTDLEAKGGTLGASWIGEDFVIGGAFAATDSNYGVPTEPDEAIRIDLWQNRADVFASLDREFLVFERSDFRFAWADYRHVELEGEEEGTVFENLGYEGRLDLVQREVGDLHGTVGFQFLLRDFEAIGDEAFTPPSSTSEFGIFLVEEYHLDPVTLEAGLRYDRNSVESNALPGGRTFDSVSFSAGAGWSITDEILIGFLLSRTERAPTAEELLSDGPHLATFSYEIGDPDLKKESGLTFELTARKRGGRFSGGINFFYTRFDDFIFAQSQGLVDEDNAGPGDLVLRQYLQTDADFYGGEVQGAYEFYQSDDLTGVLDLGLDWVRAGTRSGDDPLPRIPPLRIKAGIEARNPYADLRFEAFWVDAQNRVDDFELPTDSYVLLNLILTVHPFPDQRNVTLVLQGRNLLNQEARVHSSFLKDRLPLPGREAKLSLQVSF